MKKLFSSIRSKVWLCVSIVLIGYLTATMLGLYLNIAQYQRLSHLQLIHLPLNKLADRIVTFFEQQSEEYEDAFLLSEKELALQAAAYSERMLYEIDNILLLEGNHHDRPISGGQLQSIKQKYQHYIALAKQLENSFGTVNISVGDQAKIQAFGELQRTLGDEIHTMAATVHNSLVQEIEHHKSKALNSIFLLAVLFPIFSLIVTIFVRQVSENLLIEPLQKITDNVERFELGLTPTQPERKNTRDEIEQLASAFWAMTERLNKTTVSKRYVEKIINNMSGALVILRPDMTIHKVNQQTVQLFGHSEQQLYNQPLSMLTGTEKNNRICTEKITNLSSGQPSLQVECIAKNKAGEDIFVQISSSTMCDDKGEITDIICVFHDITRLKQAEVKLTQLAHHDQLTGLPNRNLFFDRLEQLLVDAKRHGRLFALLYLDLDKFKPINDTLGHEFGDMVLQDVSKRLQSTLRADDTIARIGGDEFIIILNAIADPKAALILAEKLVKKVIQPFKIGALSHSLGVSVGISVFPQDGTNKDTLIAKADQAMYKAKNNGGNGYCSVDTDYVHCEHAQEILDEQSCSSASQSPPAAR